SLPVEVHECEVAGMTVVVRVDADTEPGPLIEHDRGREPGDRQSRRRDHAELTGQPLDTLAAEMNVIARTKRDDLALFAAAGTRHTYGSSGSGTARSAPASPSNAQSTASSIHPTDVPSGR